MVGAEANAVLADRSATVLVERLDVVCDIAAEQHAEVFDELEGEALGETFEIFSA
ncbi:hypothetical protein D3C87_1837840 [compost metagenome]